GEWDFPDGSARVCDHSESHGVHATDKLVVVPGHTLRLPQIRPTRSGLSHRINRVCKAYERIRCFVGGTLKPRAHFRQQRREPVSALSLRYIKTGVSSLIMPACNAFHSARICEFQRVVTNVAVEVPTLRIPSTLVHKRSIRTGEPALRPTEVSSREI